MDSSASNVVALRLKPFHYPRAVVPDGLQCAEVIQLADHLPPVERADALDRQADRILALSVKLYVSAFNLALRIGAFALMPGLHDSHRGDTQWTKTPEQQPELIGQNTVRTFPADEPA